MLVKINKPVKGYGYFGGETVNIPDEIASEFVNAGAAIVVQETEGDNDNNPLPDDIPARELLFENGYESVNQIREAKDTLTDIKGIGKVLALKIVEFCEHYEG